MRSIAEFIAANDYSTWLMFNGYQRRLYVTGSNRASLPMEAWSGGGQTNSRNRDRRSQATAKYGNAVPTVEFPFDPFQATSDNHEVMVNNHEGRGKQVAKQRGGVLPPGTWIAVAKGAPGYRKTNSSFDKTFPAWWLYPYDLGQGILASKRGLETFYIHVAGFLGSDGCIVMSPDNLTLLAKSLGNKPYAFLKCTIFEGTELDVVHDLSATS